MPARPPLDKAKIARLLGEHGIVPTQIRRGSSPQNGRISQPDGPFRRRNLRPRLVQIIRENLQDVEAFARHIKSLLAGFWPRVFRLATQRPTASPALQTRSSVPQDNMLCPMFTRRSQRKRRAISRRSPVSMMYLLAEERIGKEQSVGPPSQGLRIEVV